MDYLMTDNNDLFDHYDKLLGTPESYMLPEAVRVGHVMAKDPASDEVFFTMQFGGPIMADNKVLLEDAAYSIAVRSDGVETFVRQLIMGLADFYYHQMLP